MGSSKEPAAPRCRRSIVRPRAAASLGALLLALSVAGRSQAQTEPAPPLVPPSVPPESPPPAADEGFSALTTTGLVVFTVGYLPALIVGSVAAALAELEEDDDGRTSAPSSSGRAQPEEFMPLLVPVAGPLITGALIDPTEAQWALLIASTVTQAAGLTLALIGFATEDDSPSQAGLQLSPIFVGDAGLGLAGRF